MISNASRFFLIVAMGLLLLVSSAMRALAQVKPAEPTPTPSPEITNLDKLKIPDESKLVLRNSITGQIRWKKELGTPTHPAWDFANYPCSSFVVTATVPKVDPGSFGSSAEIGNRHVENPPVDKLTEEGGYYVCGYSITDLPLNQVITVSTEFYWEKFDNWARSAGPWLMGSDPQPPPGYERVITGKRGVTLTNAEAHAVVTFEVVYAPIPVIK